MKKSKFAVFAFLGLLTFGMVCSSCKKDDDDDDKTEVVYNLEGTWHSVSLYEKEDGEVVNKDFDAKNPTEGFEVIKYEKKGENSYLVENSYFNGSDFEKEPLFEVIVKQDSIIDINSGSGVKILSYSNDKLVIENKKNDYLRQTTLSKE